MILWTQRLNKRSFHRFIPIVPPLPLSPFLSLSLALCLSCAPFLPLPMLLYRSLFLSYSFFFHLRRPSSSFPILYLYFIHHSFSPDICYEYIEMNCVAFLFLSEHKRALHTIMNMCAVWREWKTGHSSKRNGSAQFALLFHASARIWSRAIRQRGKMCRHFAYHKL